MSGATANSSATSNAGGFSVAVIGGAAAADCMAADAGEGPREA